jgi:hypothetical protein
VEINKEFAWRDWESHGKCVGMARIRTRHVRHKISEHCRQTYLVCSVCHTMKLDVSILASYSGGCGCEFWPWHRLLWLRRFVVYVCTITKIVGRCVKIRVGCHWHTLYHLQFTFVLQFHPVSHVGLYRPSAGASVNCALVYMWFTVCVNEWVSKVKLTLEQTVKAQRGE